MSTPPRPVTAPARDEIEMLRAENAFMKKQIADYDFALANMGYPPLPRHLRIEKALRDIEERLRTKTGPIANALQGNKDPEVIHAWKWAIYGSCVHAQIALGDAAMKT